SPVGHLGCERNVLIGPRARLRLVQRQECGEPSVLDQRHLQQRAHAETAAALPFGFGKRVQGFDIRDGEYATFAQRIGEYDAEVIETIASRDRLQPLAAVVESEERIA